MSRKTRAKERKWEERKRGQEDDRREKREIFDEERRSPFRIEEEAKIDGGGESKEEKERERERSSGERIRNGRDASLTIRTKVFISSFLNGRRCYLVPRHYNPGRHLSPAVLPPQNPSLSPGGRLSHYGVRIESTSPALSLLIVHSPSSKSARPFLILSSRLPAKLRRAKRG